MTDETTARTLNGCDDHEVKASTVEAWWIRALGVEVNMCACCLGPCPSDSVTCKRCRNADLSVLERAPKALRVLD